MMELEISTRLDMHRLPELEALASTALQDRSLTLGSVLICMMKKRLYLAAGFRSLWDYLDSKHKLYRLGKRQAERLIRAYSVLKLLRSHPVRPTCERQVSDHVSLVLCIEAQIHFQLLSVAFYHR